MSRPFYDTVIIVVLFCTACTVQCDSRDLKGPYLGQKPPGTKPEVAPFSGRHFDFGPQVSPDGSKMFFNFDSYKKGTDDTGRLFVCFRNKDGSWSQAIDLGEDINFAPNLCASLSPDGKYLFFASKGGIPAFKIGLWNVWLFMSVFLFQMIVMLFADKRIQEKSHVPKEARKERFERYVGIIGNFIWLLAMGYSVFLPLRLGTIWFFIGLSVFIIGLALLVIATFNFITTPATLLITKGAYNFSRHPMYLSTFFICLGAGIAAESWIFIFLSLIMAYCFYHEALIEERYCLKRYSNAYREYMSRIPRWIGVPKKCNK